MLLIYDQHKYPSHLNGYDNRRLIVPEYALKYAHTQKGRSYECEPAILRDSQFAYLYARYIIQDRWPEAEQIILTSPTSSRLYATYVLGHPWPEAEDIIATDAYNSYNYAVGVIKGRWKPGEDAIRMSGFETNFYMSDILEPLYPNIHYYDLYAMFMNGTI